MRPVATAVLIALFSTLTYSKATPGEKVSIQDTASLTLAVLRRQHLWQTAVFVCDITDGVRLMRVLGHHVRTSVISDLKNVERRLEGPRARLGVLVLAQKRCFQTTQSLLKSVSIVVKSHLNSTYRWMMSGESLQDVLSDLEPISIAWDTSLIAMIPEEHSPRAHRLFDLYKTHPQGTSLSAKQIAVWRSSRMENWTDAENSLHRKNMFGERLTYGAVVTHHKDWDDSKLIETYDLPPHHPRLPDENVQIMLFHVLRITSVMFNYTLTSVKGYKGPGYPQEDGSYTDLMGAFQRGEINISVTGLLVLNHRRKVISYLNACFHFQDNALVYLSTNAMATPSALIQPFSPILRAAVAASLLIGALLITFFVYIESREEEKPKDISISKSSLIVLGSLSGQGEPPGTSWLSSQVLLLVMMVFGILIYCAYSAVIVRFLLSEPTANYPTREKFMKSPLKVAAFDFYFYRYDLFGPNMTKVHRELYEKKMGAPGGFKKLKPGFKGLVEGRWAMLVPPLGLYTLMQYATAQQICRIFEVKDIPTLMHPACPLIQKNSPATNMINRGTSLIRERGVYNRFQRIWFAPKITCPHEGARQWSPVTLQVLTPVFILIACGVIGALGLLLMENFLGIVKSGKKCCSRINRISCVI